VRESHRLQTTGSYDRVKWRVGAAIGLVVAVAAVVVAVVTAARHDKDRTGLAVIPTSPPAISAPATSGGGGRTGGGPPPPKSGAWVGAVVQPTDFTKEGEEAALTGWETQMGRKMDLVHTYHTWDNAFPDDVDRWAVAGGRALLLSWGGTDTRVIQTGRYDDMIRQRARDVRTWGKPVLLQWRWEMDRPNLQTQIWSPEDYIAAWIHIRAIFRTEKVTNVSWVWCPTADGFADGRAQKYYPGNAQVDWTCADVYPGDEDTDFATKAAPYLDWVKRHPKPSIIGEYGAYGGFPGGQAAWVDQAAAVAKKNPLIKGLIYFNWDDENRRPKTQLSLRGNGNAVNAYRAFIADPYFNPRSLPVKQ
jgi:hypothetical protein